MTLDDWLTGGPSLSADEARWAQLAWRRIHDRPTTITIRRGGAALSAQTVRIEPLLGAREDDDRELNAAALPGVARAIVFGVRGHPTAADTNIQRGDRFIYSGGEAEVTAVVQLPGEVQALCEVRT
jgi:hypothetical protein